MDSQTPVIGTIDHDDETMVRVVTTCGGALVGRVDNDDAGQECFRVWEHGRGEPIWVQVRHVVSIQKQRR